MNKWSHAHRRECPRSQPPSRPHFSSSASEDEDAAENVASQQRQSTQWTLPSCPEGVQCKLLLRPAKGKARKQHTLLENPLHLAFAAVLHGIYYLAGGGDIVTAMTN
jgi:hypothetical protein